MAFNRIVNVLASRDGIDTEISALDLDFTIEKSRDRDKNSAELVVFNAKSETQFKLFQSGTRVTISAGYEDEGVGIIYIGEVDVANNKKTKTDWETKLTLFSEGTSQQVTYSLGYSPNISMAIIINFIGTSRMLAIQGLELVQTLFLPNGFTFVGSYENLLDEITAILMEHGIRIYVDDGVLVLYTNEFPNVRVFVLGYNTGLLSAQDISTKEDGDKKRVQVDCLLIHQIAINSQILLQGTSHDGQYIVDRYIINGSNYRDDFNMTIEGTQV